MRQPHCTHAVRTSRLTASSSPSATCESAVTFINAHECHALHDSYSRNTQKALELAMLYTTKRISDRAFVSKIERLRKSECST
eukprot:5714685-Pleurochrysis_carterae.AAC.1